MELKTPVDITLIGNTGLREQLLDNRNNSHNTMLKAEGYFEAS
jgi:hypothetical protein